MLNSNKTRCFLFILIFVTFIFNGCTHQSEKVIIFHAGSLSVPFEEIEREFEKSYPHMDVQREPSGSLTCARKVTDLGKEADIIASADYTVIDDLLIPDYAHENILFARNEMVIMYDRHSLYGDEINQGNWPEILKNPEVSYGYSDPNADPSGYRALMLWQLAEKYYKIPQLYETLKEKCPKNNIRPKSTDLIPLLESGELDYVFTYYSVAVQHNKPFVKLPPQLNLSDSSFEDFYKEAVVDIVGKKPGEVITHTGKPIVYGVALLKGSEDKEGARKFMEFLLSKEDGLRIMEKHGQQPLDPIIKKKED